MVHQTSIVFPGLVHDHLDRPLPEPAVPLGYAALISAYQLEVPIPRQLYAASQKHRITNSPGWRLLTPRHAPASTLVGHLVFAIKYEGLDLAVLKALFEKSGPGAIEVMVKAVPTSSYGRRCWFLYEWLLEEQLSLPDAHAGAYVPVVAPELQWSVSGQKSARHRVVDNLPGTRRFCPMGYVTPRLGSFRDKKFSDKAHELAAATPQDVLARAAAFLLLKDSRSSFAIEGEHPPHDRIQRWGRAIAEAGRHPLSIQELERLQRVVIGNTRFVNIGLRKQGGFVGEHDRDTGQPLPAHISARHEDLLDLLEGIAAFDERAKGGLDAVLHAAAVAFGFVYIHPFEDGNGRIHRYLIHHVLAEQGFAPAGIVFPISSAILSRIGDYVAVLESYSQRLLPCILWQLTPQGNVAVLNKTADYYRYFDATPHAEFLYECIEQTIEVELPKETGYLQSYDAFRAAINEIVDMPGPTLELLSRFLRQNGGRLSKRARQKEFAAFSEEEVDAVERIYGDLFSGEG